MPASQPTLRHLTPADLPAMFTIVESVGWDITPRKFEHYLRWAGDGAYGLCIDDHLVAIGALFCYADKLAWLAMIITHADQQGKGLGYQITKVLINHAHERGIQHIMLDASEAGKKLYDRMGFRSLYMIEKWDMQAAPAIHVIPDPAEIIRPLEPADLAAVIAFDAELFHAPRPAILRGFTSSYPDHCWIAEVEGTLQGVLLTKNWEGNEQVHIGPWLHRTPVGAERLLHTAVNGLSGHTLSVNIPGPNAAARDIIQRCGFTLDSQCTRMILGTREPPMPAPITGSYGIAGYATG